MENTPAFCPAGLGASATLCIWAQHEHQREVFPEKREVRAAGSGRLAIREGLHRLASCPSPSGQKDMPSGSSPSFHPFTCCSSSQALLLPGSIGWTPQEERGVSPELPPLSWAPVASITLQPLSFCCPSPTPHPKWDLLIFCL